MEYSAKTSLPLYTIGIIYPFAGIPSSLKIGIIFTHIHLYHWRESNEGSQSLHFWRLMPKGEKVLAQSKSSAPPYRFSKFKVLMFSIGFFKINIPLRNSISIGIYIFKRGVFFKKKFI
jgi:hypothetical protein